MMLSVYAYKDNALGCYTTPFFDDRPSENVGIGVARAIIASEKKSSMKHKVLYKIGTYDDAKGSITPCEPELILDCDEVLARVGSENAETKNS